MKRKIAVAVCVAGLIWNIRYDIKMLYPHFDLFSMTKNFAVVNANWWNYPYPTVSNHDTLLYTLFSCRSCIIHPDSWYKDYVAAFAHTVVYDLNCESIVVSSEIDLSIYREVGSMSPTVHETLFEADIAEQIVAEGAPKLYINLDGMMEQDSIVLFHDEYGNIYLRAGDGK